MEKKWKKSKEQLDLMINENCTKSKFEIIVTKNNYLFDLI